jgi:hypothetical protein
MVPMGKQLVVEIQGPTSIEIILEGEKQNKYSGV